LPRTNTPAYFTGETLRKEKSLKKPSEIYFEMAMFLTNKLKYKKYFKIKI
jgi:hypothetical protein